jgi:hypothetical protein
VGYKVFLSHSMAEADRDLVAQIAGVIQGHGIECYIASRDYQLGHQLPEKIAGSLRSSDSLVALLTQGGSHGEWVNQEIGFARGIGKLTIPVLEVGVEPSGFLVGLEYLRLDRGNAAHGLDALGQYLTGLRQKKETTELIVGAAVVAALIVIIVLSSEGGGAVA